MGLPVPCRYTLLPFKGWSPAAHRDYPPLMRSAFKAVLLAASRPAQKRGRAGLESLPQEVLLRILGAAAWKIDSWVM